MDKKEREARLQVIHAELIKVRRVEKDLLTEARTLIDQNVKSLFS